jgi:hypothetical protein
MAPPLLFKPLHSMLDVGNRYVSLLQRIAYLPFRVARKDGPEGFA